MTTPFGKAVRKLRIDSGKRLKDMADALSVQPAYISAVEMGRKRITPEFTDKTITWLKLVAPASVDRGVIDGIRELVDSSQPDLKVKMSGFDDGQREVFVAFARKFQGLSGSDRQKLMDLIGDENK